MPAKWPRFKQSARVSEAEAKLAIEQLLLKWFDKPPTLKRLESGADFAATLGSTKLIMEFKASADAASVRAAIQQLGKSKKSEIPIVVVPYMGEVGRRLCEEARVSWLDLSGNADIRAPRLRVLVDGMPNRYVQRGRPATPFAPKSSRLTRWLLIHPSNSFTQRELARATGLDVSQISRLVRRLQEQRLVRVGENGHVALADRKLLLEEWASDYRFQQHRILQGHIPGRSGPETVEHVSRALGDANVSHAFTGLAGAWPYTQASAFRLVTVYVNELPTAARLRAIDFVPNEKGSNAWFVVPVDEGVFDGSRDFDGARYAHPVQVWLDLKEQPERSKEVASDLRDRILKGEFDG